MISIKFIEKIPVTSTNAAGIMKSGIPVPVNIFKMIAFFILPYPKHPIKCDNEQCNNSPYYEKQLA